MIGSQVVIVTSTGPTLVKNSVQIIATYNETLDHPVVRESDTHGGTLFCLPKEILVKLVE